MHHTDLTLLVDHERAASPAPVALIPDAEVVHLEPRGALALQPRGLVRPIVGRKVGAIPDPGVCGDWKQTTTGAG